MSGLTCENARHLFDAHLNGELSVALETELNAHRLRCAACRHDLALLEVAGEVITVDHAAPALGEEFTARLLACVTAQQTRRRLHRHQLYWWGTRVLAPAACIVLAVIALRGPERKVAGDRREAPRTRVSRGSAFKAVTPAPISARVSPKADFQAQLERALTEWRRDASSLRKIYDFITPQVYEELRLEQPENVPDQPDWFEPGLPDAIPEGVPAPHQPIEDI